MRIVSLAPSNTEILYALGVEDQIVAVTRFCDWPHAAKEKTQIGSWLTTNPERIAELKPDLILTSMWLPESTKAWTGPGKVLHVDPKNLWDVFESMRTIGDAVGASVSAARIVQQMEEAFERIRSEATATRPHVYMEEWFDPPMAAGNWVPEIVAVAGGEEVLMEPNQPSKTFSLPALTVANPDAVICHWCGWGNRVDESRILARPGWDAVNAVAEGRVFFVDDSLLNRPGPRLVEGARALQKIFREELAR